MKNPRIPQPTTNRSRAEIDAHATKHSYWGSAKALYGASPLPRGGGSQMRERASKVGSGIALRSHVQYTRSVCERRTLRTVSRGYGVEMERSTAVMTQVAGNHAPFSLDG